MWLVSRSRWARLLSRPVLPGSGLPGSVLPGSGAASAQARSTRAGKLGRVVAAVLAVQLVVQLAGVTVLSGRTGAAPGTAGSPAPVRGAPGTAGTGTATPGPLRADAVRALLDARAAAVRTDDRAAFIATLWPGAPEFLRRQGEMFDAVQAVPLASWSYELDPTVQQPPNAALDAKYGAGNWWAPGVVLRYAIARVDTEPTSAPQRVTFVRQGDRWLLAADDDFDALGHKSVRALWDFGPVVRQAGAHCLALGHPGSEGLLAQLCATVDAAVPRVSAVWGTAWSQQVLVLVPDNSTELDRILGGTTDLTNIAAVATAELTDTTVGYHPVGDRVAVNPPNFAKLGPLGRQVVLTHETTHVATRAATGPAVPTWLVEGIADYVGYLGVPVPLATAAHDLQTSVRAGKLPSALPADAEFGGGNPDLAAVYESAWLAFRLLVDTYGRDAALRFYRAVGASRGVGAQAAVDTAFSAVLGTTTTAFTAAWRAYLAKTFR